MTVCSWQCNEISLYPFMSPCCMSPGCSRKKCNKASTLFHATVSPDEIYQDLYNHSCLVNTLFTPEVEKAGKADKNGESGKLALGSSKLLCPLDTK